MKTCSFKKYESIRKLDKSDSIGISIHPNITWTGSMFQALYPNLLISRTQFGIHYWKRLDRLDPQVTRLHLESMAMGKAICLLSNNLAQRKIVNEWLECEEYV